MEEFPVVEGYIYKPEEKLVIKKCPYCGLPHFHGWAKKYERIGSTTQRWSHCSVAGKEGGEYCIKIVGFLTEEEYEKLEKKVLKEVFGYEGEKVVHDL